MDLETVLDQALSTEAEQRTKAENQLLFAVQDAGIILQHLLPFVVNVQAKQTEDVSRHRRLLAASVVRNAVCKHWQFAGKGATASWRAEHREALRNALLQACLAPHLPDTTTSLMRVAVCHIARRDWPDSWPSLLPSLMSGLEQAVRQAATGGAAAVNCAACMNSVVKELSKKNSNEDRRRMDSLCRDMFPALASCTLTAGQLMMGRLQEGGGGGDAPAWCAVWRKCVKACVRLLQCSMGPSFLVSCPAVPALTAAMAAVLAQGTEHVRGQCTQVQGQGGTILQQSLAIDEAVTDSLPSLLPVLHALKRTSWGVTELVRAHGVSFPGCGQLAPVLLWAANNIAQGRPMTADVLSTMLVSLSIVLDVGQRLRSGESPGTFEVQAVGQAEAGADWANAGVQQVQHICQTLFGPSVADSWLASLIGQCLPVTPREIEEEWAVDSEEAALAQGRHEQGGHPRQAAEALLCALIADEPGTARARVVKIFGHAQSMEQALLSLPPSAWPSAQGAALLLQVEAAWLACGLAAADAQMLQPPVLHELVAIEWTVTRILPLLHLLGLDVPSALAGLPPLAGAEALPARLAGLPGKGALMQQHGVAAQLCLRRALWMFNTMRGVLPGRRTGSDASMHPCRHLYLNLCLQGLQMQAGEALDLGAVRMAATETSSAIIEDCAYAEDAINSPHAVLAIASAVYTALPTLAFMDGKLALLHVLQSTVKHLSAVVKVACIQPLLSPLGSLWSAALERGGDCDPGEASLVRRSILELVSHVVEALPLHPPAQRPPAEAINGLLDSLAPLVRASCDPSSDSWVYLCSDGLALWAALVEASPGSGLPPSLARLYPLLQECVQADTSKEKEYLPTCLRICTDILLRCPSAASMHPSVFPALLHYAVGHLHPRYVGSLANALHVVLSVLGKSGAETVLQHGLGGRLVVWLHASIGKRSSDAAATGQTKRALLAQLLAGGTAGQQEADDGPNQSSSDDSPDAIAPSPDLDAIRLYGGMLATLCLHTPSAFAASVETWVSGGQERMDSLTAHGVVPKGSALAQACVPGQLPAATSAILTRLRLLSCAVDSCLWCAEDIGSASVQAQPMPSSVTPNGSAVMGNKLLALAASQLLLLGAESCTHLYGASTGAGLPEGTMAAVMQLGKSAEVFPLAPHRVEALYTLGRGVLQSLASCGLPARGSNDKLALYGLARSPARVSRDRGAGGSIGTNDADAAGGVIPAEAQELSTARSAAYLYQPEVTLDLEAALVAVQALPAA